jgi:hypothetical protein
VTTNQRYAQLQRLPLRDFFPIILVTLLPKKHCFRRLKILDLRCHEQSP